MIPIDGLDEFDEELEEEIDVEPIPDTTYKLDFKTMRISNRIDEEDALKQAILKILLTEANTYIIYDDYGREINELFGDNNDEVVEIIGERIEDAILKDDRFDSVEITDISFNRNVVMVSLTVITVEEDEIEMEGVEINV